MIAASPFPMLLLSERAEIQATNPAFSRVFEFSAREAESLRWPDLFGREQQTEALAAWMLCSQTGAFRGQLHPTAKSGAASLEASVALWRLQGDTARVASFDFSFSSASVAGQRRRAAERWELALQASDDGLWDWNLESGEVYFSARTCSLLGYGQREFGNTFAAMTERIHPRDKETFTRALHDHRCGKRPQFQAEIRLRHRDHSWRDVLVRGMLLRDAKRKPYRMTGAVTDLTEVRRVEHEAREHQAALAHALRVATVNELASALTHEMHQPLGAILNYANGCLRRSEAGNLEPAALRQALAAIAEQASRAAVISRRSRDFLRKTQPDRQRHALQPLLEEVALLTEADVHRRAATLTVELSDGPTFINADRVQLQQVLVNLIQNALEAFIQADSPRREIKLTCNDVASAAPSAVEVTVADTGPGLPADVQKSIFEPFYTTKASGLGLGLAISRSIVAGHDGELTVESRVGIGTTFRLKLPVVPAPAKDNAATVPE